MGTVSNISFIFYPNNCWSAPDRIQSQCSIGSVSSGKSLRSANPAASFLLAESSTRRFRFPARLGVKAVCDLHHHHLRGHSSSLFTFTFHGYLISSVSSRKRETWILLRCRCVVKIYVNYFTWEESRAHRPDVFPPDSVSNLTNRQKRVVLRLLFSWTNNLSEILPVIK